MLQYLYVISKMKLWLVFLVLLFCIEEDKAKSILQSTYPTIHIVGKLQRIVGGSSSFLGEYPWQGLFWRRIGDSNLYSPICGCSLLDDQWAITAAHCTYGLKPSSILLDFNLYNTSDFTNAQTYFITEIKEHPLYNPTTLENDISLLKFSVKVLTSANVQPIALPTQGVDETVGKNCTISGWGRTSFGGPSSQILLKATVPVLDNQVCNNWYNPFNISISSKQICAGYREGGVDTCQGDSGGPLACPVEKGTYILQGITSFGIGCALAERPGVYARISEYVTWINSIREDVPTTTEYMPTTETATTKVVPTTTEYMPTTETATTKVVSTTTEYMPTTETATTKVVPTTTEYMPTIETATTKVVSTTIEYMPTTETATTKVVPTTTEYMPTTETATTIVVSTLANTTTLVSATNSANNNVNEISTSKGSLNKCCYTLHLLVAATVVIFLLKSLI